MYFKRGICMNLFKNVKNKLILITIVVILVNFLFSTPVSAKSFLATAGGKLLVPISELLVFVRRLYY